MEELTIRLIYEKCLFFVMDGLVYICILRKIKFLLPVI